MIKKIHGLPILLILVLLISQPVTARELSIQEKEMIASVVKKDLNDPESARFRWVPLQRDKDDTYCGLVTAKNSFGGYSGWAPYIVSPVWHSKTGKMGGVSMIRIGTTGADSPSTLAVMEICAKKGYTELFLAE